LSLPFDKFKQKEVRIVDNFLAAFVTSSGSKSILFATMRITRKDILTVFGVLMAVLVTATLRLSESRAVQMGVIPDTPEIALQLKKTTQKLKLLVQLKSFFRQTDQR
jgi:hypothetical protein